MRTQLVTLKLGFKVNEQRLKDVVLREPTVADYIAAEVNAPVYRQYAFKVALISRLIEKLEGFDGEVTMGMMKELKPVDVARLSDALCASCRRRHFLFFASPKKRKQKKGDCGHRFGFAKLPSLHAVFRVGLHVRSGAAASCEPTRKTALRSAAPAGGWQACLRSGAYFVFVGIVN